MTDDTQSRMCPACGGELLSILYGQGSCVFSDSDPDLQCAECGVKFCSWDVDVIKAWAGTEKGD
jgi:hypothetical protein